MRGANINKTSSEFKARPFRKKNNSKKKRMRRATRYLTRELASCNLLRRRQRTHNDWRVGATVGVATTAESPPRTPIWICSGESSPGRSRPIATSPPRCRWRSRWRPRRSRVSLCVIYSSLRGSRPSRMTRLLPDESVTPTMWFRMRHPAIAT